MQQELSSSCAGVFILFSYISQPKVDPKADQYSLSCNGCCGDFECLLDDDFYHHSLEFLFIPAFFFSFIIVYLFHFAPLYISN
jgi:hypothetical protein